MIAERLISNKTGLPASDSFGLAVNLSISKLKNLFRSAFSTNIFEFFISIAGIRDDFVLDDGCPALMIFVLYIR